MERISASLVLYQCSEAIFAGCIRSILDSQSFTRLVIVDNSPEPTHSPMFLSDLITYLHRPDNPGFGAAHNYAFSFCKDTDLHFVLNPDIAFAADVPQKIIEKMRHNPEIGLLMPNVVYPDGQRQSLCKLLPTPMNLITRRFMRHSALTDALDKKYELRDMDDMVEQDIPCLSGCFMVLRGEVFRTLGGFDEQFFMYLEDVDLSRRVHRIARTVYWPEVSVVHIFQKASYKSSRLLWIHMMSAMRYFNKWGWFFDHDRKMINQRTLDKLMLRKDIA